MKLYELISLDDIIPRPYLGEIEMMPVQQFSPNEIIKWLPHATLQDQHINGCEIYLLDKDGSRLIAAWDDESKKLAAFALFVNQPQIRARLWTAKNAETFTGYSGKLLTAGLYKYCKQTLGMTIQSDMQQSPGSKQLWTKSLPTSGLYPKVLDTETNLVMNTRDIDPYIDNNLRYCWIIESNDQYSNQIPKGSMLQPYNRIYANIFEIRKPALMEISYEII